MADLKINPSKLETLLRRYRPTAETKAGVGGTTELVMLCPFHSDSRPSFHFNLHKGVGYCFSCPKKKKYNLSETISEFEGKSLGQADSFLRQEGIYEKAKKEAARTKEEKEDSCGIKLEQLDAWHEALRLNAQSSTKLAEITGWSLDTLRKFRIGYNGQSYTIPLIVNNIVVNVKYYTPEGPNKYKGETSHNAPRLWPLESLDKPGPIWLMEGEKDCILAIQNGLNAVTFTGGAGKIATNYLSRFKGRDVYVVYDIDPAGKAGAVTAAEHLVKIANSVRIIDIPEDGLPATGDFTDFVHHAKHDPIELTQIAHMTHALKPKDSKTKVAISDEVYNTYLEEVIPKKMFYKRVRMRVRLVSMSQGETYLVPKETHANCARNLGDQCFTCALNFTDGQELILDMKPEYPEIMQLIDNDDTKQRTALKSLMDIYPKCPKVKFEFKSFQAFYPVVLIPALEKDKINHSYTMKTAWALDVPSEMNEDYLAEAVVMSDPGSQKMVILCYKLDKDLSSVDAFELTDEMREELKIFSCQNLQPSATN